MSKLDSHVSLDLLHLQKCSFNVIQIFYDDFSLLVCSYLKGWCISTMKCKNLLRQWREFCGELQVFLDLEKKNPSVMLLLRIELEFLQLSEQSYRWLHRTCSWLWIFPCWSLAFSLFLVIYLFSEFIAALFEPHSCKMFNGDSWTPLGLLDWRVLEWFGFDKLCFDWWLRPLISYQVRSSGCKTSKFHLSHDMLGFMWAAIVNQNCHF